MPTDQFGNPYTISPAGFRVYQNPGALLQYGHTLPGFADARPSAQPLGPPTSLRPLLPPVSAPSGASQAAMEGLFGPSPIQAWASGAAPAGHSLGGLLPMLGRTAAPSSMGSGDPLGAGLNLQPSAPPVYPMHEINDLLNLKRQQAEAAVPPGPLALENAKLGATVAGTQARMNALPPIDPNDPRYAYEPMDMLAYPERAFPSIPGRPAPQTDTASSLLGAIAGFVDPRGAGMYNATPLHAAANVANVQYQDRLRNYEMATQQAAQQMHDAELARAAQLENTVYNRAGALSAAERLGLANDRRGLLNADLTGEVAGAQSLSDALTGNGQQDSLLPALIGGPAGSALAAMPSSNGLIGQTHSAEQSAVDAANTQEQINYTRDQFEAAKQEYFLTGSQEAKLRMLVLQGQIRSLIQMQKDAAAGVRSTEKVEAGKEIAKGGQETRKEIAQGAQSTSRSNTEARVGAQVYGINSRATTAANNLAARPNPGAKTNYLMEQNRTIEADPDVAAARRAVTDLQHQHAVAVGHGRPTTQIDTELSAQQSALTNARQRAANRYQSQNKPGGGVILPAPASGVHPPVFQAPGITVRPKG